MNAIGIIPARMGASRFPGKPMETLMGMPMIGHCYHRTSLTPGISSVYVATCDDVIAKYIRGIGGNVVMTSPSHDRASTRTAEAMHIIQEDMAEEIDVVVMVQGDEPVILPKTIARTLPHFENADVSIVNIMSKISTRDAFEDHNNVKVVVDSNSNALYFSREPIPSPWKGWEGLPKYMQTGIIAFTKSSLTEFNNTPETPLEKYESVDMNRVIENGGSIKMVATDDYTIGVDTPSELKMAEQFLMNDATVAEYL